MWLLTAWLSLGDVGPTLTDFPLQTLQFELPYFQLEIMHLKQYKAAVKKYAFSPWE